MAYDIYINGGFIIIKDTGLDVVRNPRAESTYERTSATEFEFKYKNPNPDGSSTTFNLATTGEAFAYAD